MKRFSVGLVLKTVVMIVACAVIIGFLTMGLWNWLIPELFHGPVITYWQALGLLILSKLLLGGFSKGGDTPWGEKHRRDWKAKMKAKMQHMSPEDKLRMKQNLSRCMRGRWAELEEDEQREQQRSQQPPFENTNS